MNAPTVFLCHTKPNYELIREHLVPILSEQHTSYFLINWGNMAWDEYEEHIVERIIQAEVFVACVSQEALESIWVKREITIAFDKKDPERIFCLRLDSTDPLDLNRRLSNVPQVDLSDGQRIRELIHSMKVRVDQLS